MSNKEIDSIGIIGYPWSILTGNNIEFSEFHDFNKEENIRGEFIVTVSKRAVIATELINNQRKPIIVKKWNKVEKSNSDERPQLKKEGVDFTCELYLDSDERYWSYYYSDKGHTLINCRSKDGNLIYEFKK